MKTSKETGGRPLSWPLDPRHSPLDRAIVHCGGTISSLATALRAMNHTMSYQTVRSWRLASHVPFNWWLALQTVTAGEVLALEFLYWQTGHPRPREAAEAGYIGAATAIEAARLEEAA